MIKNSKLKNKILFNYNADLYLIDQLYNKKDANSIRIQLDTFIRDTYNVLESEFHEKFCRIFKNIISINMFKISEISKKEQSLFKNIINIKSLIEDNEILMIILKKYNCKVEYI